MVVYSSSDTNVPIVDIRLNDMKDTLASGIYQGLAAENGKPISLPTQLLYDTRGLRLFEDITYVEEYYLTNAEIEALNTHAAEIVERIPDNAQLVELGSGNLRKIKILLDEFDRAKKRVDYLALDLSLEELNRTFAEIPSYEYVTCRGLWGTYDDALAWLRTPANRQKPTVIMSMGSSLGNFTRDEAATFLGEFTKTLLSSDCMLIGLDSCKDPDKVSKAYNDSKGVTRQFYLNGLNHANLVLGRDYFKADEWDVVGNYDESDGCHRAYFVPLKDVTVNGFVLKKGTKIFFEQAFKYGKHECEELWEKAGLIERANFGNSTGDYYLHFLSSAHLILPTSPTEYAANPTPSLQDFQALWTLWDTVTLGMVPKEELLSKPIKLRNALIFYLGHIPTFLDIHLTRATNENPTEPRHYPRIFERGIDPDVDNPELCHDHSEIPDEYPPVEEILQFQQKVRSRARYFLEKNRLVGVGRRIAEALWIGFEHEAMHLETFLYMLVQSERILPPPRVDKPDFEAMARDAAAKAVSNEWFQIPQQNISIGFDDPDPAALPAVSFGWDNEKPRRTANVDAFSAKARPITNGEYLQYILANKIRTIPASWIEKGGASSREFNGTVPNGRACEFYVRTVFGPVPLRWALDWPVVASYDELQGYAQWVGCRLPSYEEVLSIYQYSASLKSKKSNEVYPLLNGDGAQTSSHSQLENRDEEKRSLLPKSPLKPRTPDHQPVQQGQQISHPVYIDLDGCNVGFKHWHPTPVTQDGNKLSGRGEFGGVWEWTSTPLHAHEGFKAMELYPGYTADFFDSKHNIVLGGSWATHPRISGRTTFVNWYQRNYPYVWAGARLVRDL
ncbi:hypothetical protein VTO42DRAFT_3926 [Malbranchea cinnamomea]